MTTRLDRGMIALSVLILRVPDATYQSRKAYRHQNVTGTRVSGGGFSFGDCMSSIIPFSFAHNQVRVIVSEAGDPWFVAQDVSTALQYSEASAMTRTLDDDEKGLQTVQTPGGKQELVTINESGLYSAILRSRRPEAKRFKKWVTSEVLPSIRKTGMYAVQTPSVPGDLYARALKAEKDEAASMALASVAGKALSLRRKEKRVLAQIVGLLREEVQLKLTLASIDGGVK